jgi:hypothetical protein
MGIALGIQMQQEPFLQLFPYTNAYHPRKIHFLCKYWIHHLVQFQHKLRATIGDAFFDVRLLDLERGEISFNLPFIINMPAPDILPPAFFSHSNIIHLETTQKQTCAASQSVVYYEKQQEQTTIVRRDDRSQITTTTTITSTTAKYWSKSATRLRKQKRIITNYIYTYIINKNVGRR